jgi:vitamin B12 transporter
MLRFLTRPLIGAGSPSVPVRRPAVAFALVARALPGFALLLVAGDAAAQAAVPPGDTVPARPSPVVLDTLPVLGSRTSAELPLRTRGVQVLDRERLDALPARSVADALRWATGVELSARSPAQADLQLRGGTFEQVLVLVDGVRMSDPQTGHFDLDLTVPFDRVERIEILRGPASAQYGSDAVGGVVNVVTRSRTSGASARLEGGSFGTATLALSGSTAVPGDLQFDASVEGGRSDGHRDGTDWEHLLGSIRVTAPLAGGRLRGDLGAARRDFGADDFYAPFPSFEATRTETAALSWQPAPAARVRIEPRVTWRAHDDDFTLIRDNPAVYRNVHRSTQLGADVAVRFAIGEGRGPATGALVAVGGEAARHGLDSNALGDRAESRGALFAEVTGRPLPGTDVSLGLRHDQHERWGGFTSPSLAVAHELASAVRVRASWGRAFRGPTWTERFYADPGHVPNPDVRPEKGSAWELGLSVEPVDGLGLSVAGFTRTTRDLIDWARPALPPGVIVDPSPPWVPRNVNEARFRGLEVEGNWRPNRSTRFTAGVSLLSARTGGETGLESKYALRPLTEKVTLGLERMLPGELLASVRLTRARRGGVRDLDSGARVTDGEPAFQDVDLRLVLPIPFPGAQSGARVFLDARNLLDADHPDLTGNAVPGRAFVLGIEVVRGR